MNATLINEINNFKYISFIKLIEDDGSIQIDICGTCKKSALLKENNSDYKNDIKVAEVLKNTNEIFPDTSVIYHIIFNGYISYNVINESYTSWDDCEKFECGNLFRIYTKSRYLDFISTTTIAMEIENKFVHYGICCLNNIIDIISTDEPIITKQIL